MVIYLTLKFASKSLGGLEIEFAAFIILDIILIGWFVDISLSSIEKKRLPIGGIDPHLHRFLDESATTELSWLVMKSMIEMIVYTSCLKDRYLHKSRDPY